MKRVAHQMISCGEWRWGAAALSWCCTAVAVVTQFAAIEWDGSTSTSGIFHRKWFLWWQVLPEYMLLLPLCLLLPTVQTSHNWWQTALYLSLHFVCWITIASLLYDMQYSWPLGTSYLGTLWATMAELNRAFNGILQMADVLIFFLKRPLLDWITILSPVMGGVFDRSVLLNFFVGINFLYIISSEYGISKNQIITAIAHVVSCILSVFIWMELAAYFFSITITVVTHSQLYSENLPLKFCLCGDVLLHS